MRALWVCDANKVAGRRNGVSLTQRNTYEGNGGSKLNAKACAWLPYAGLLVALAAPAADMTAAFSRLNSRTGDLGQRMGRLETKVDATHQKLDRLLLALASRGVVLPAKIDGKQSEAER